MAQGYNDRLDESLGMRRGKEYGMKQSYKSRRDEYRGMKRAMKEDKKGGGVFNLKDGAQEGDVRMVNTNTEQYDLSRVKKYSCGSKGYPAEAWKYDY
jgi:hypothetical protein